MNSAELLLDLAVRSSVTDVVLTPGTGTGNLHLRDGFRSVHSAPLPHTALRVLARQLSRLAGLPAEAPALRLQVGSITHRGARVRVTRMLTEGGPVVRLRLQMQGLLEQALQEFSAGRYGGLDVLPFLEMGSGLLVVGGAAAAGKTCALSHLLSSCRGRVLLVSEARELSADLVLVDPAGRSGSEIASEVARRTPAVLALDETDEALKLEVARQASADRLVLCTLTAPDLPACVRRVRAAGVEPERLLGVFRVTWAQETARLRRPDYRWYPVGRHQNGLCPICDLPRAVAGPCPGCGLPPVRQVLDRVILERMNSPEGYRALDRLEQEWRA